MVDNGVRSSLAELARYRDLLKNLTQRELRSRYRRSVLGWGWSLLQPVLMTLVYAVMLGFYFKVTPEPGNPSGIDILPLFVLSGLLPWNFLAAGLTSAMGTVVNAGSLMTRVYFPRLLLPMSTLIALAVSLMIELGILVTIISLWTQRFLLHLLPMAALLVLLLLLFTAGLAFWLAACNVRFRDVEYLTTILLTAYFYLTPVIYSITFIPEKPVLGTGFTWRDLALMNPMARFAMAFRNVFYDVRLPGAPTLFWVAAWATLSFVSGHRFFVRRADRFAELM
jgi:lipopolysaccharide transport system permease protein